MLFKLSNLLQSKEGRLIMSALLGFGLATLFRASCQGSDCMIRVAPPYEKMTGTFKFGGKCYTFMHKNVKCNTNAISFE